MSQKPTGVKHKYVIGIDPGSTGALCVCKDGKNVFKMIMPKIDKELDYRKLAKFFLHYKKKGAIVYLEKVWGRGGTWGATQNFNLGNYYGSVRAAMAMCNLPYVLITAKKWQDYVFEGVSVIYKATKSDKKKLKDTKAMALVASRRLFPTTHMVETGTKQKVAKDGIVDASLIAYYGYMRG